MILLCNVEIQYTISKQYSRWKKSSTSRFIKAFQKSKSNFVNCLTETNFIEKSKKEKKENTGQHQKGQAAQTRQYK